MSAHTQEYEFSEKLTMGKGVLQMIMIIIIIVEGMLEMLWIDPMRRVSP